MDDQSQYKSQLSDELDIEAKLEMFLKSSYHQGEEKIRDQDSIKSPMLPPSYRTKNTIKTSSKLELDFPLPNVNVLDPIYKVAKDDKLNSDDSELEGDNPEKKEVVSDSLASS